VDILREHPGTYSADGVDGLVFPGAKGSVLRRGNFNIVKALGLQLDAHQAASEKKPDDDPDDGAAGILAPTG
jgi:hypothetical protein